MWRSFDFFKGFMFRAQAGNFDTVQYMHYDDQE